MDQLADLFLGADRVLSQTDRARQQEARASYRQWRSSDSLCCELCHLIPPDLSTVLICFPSKGG